MALVGDGIDRVRAIELPGGVWANGKSVGAPRLALVKWHSCWSDRYHQVYVNGGYAGTTIDSQQREMVVRVPTSLETPVRIGVFAVEAGEADTDFSDEIDLSRGRTGRIRITFLRGQNLPINSTAHVYFDNGSGEIDYDRPLSERPIQIWPAWQDKAGFGMGGFGEGDFGYDSAAAVGFGKGSFGLGQFGLDADTFEWMSRPLPAGVYKFGVRICDDAGNQSVSAETGQITVIPAAKPAEEVEISSFDKENNELVLSIS